MARFAAFAWATLAWVFPIENRVTSKAPPAGAGALRFTFPHWLGDGAEFRAAIRSGVALLTCWPAGAAGRPGRQCRIWARRQRRLALAVLAFTSRVQSHTRADYRFPVPVVAELMFRDGRRVYGTVDDLTDSGMRLLRHAAHRTWRRAHPSPPDPAADGPLPLWGQVRSVIAEPDDSGPRAVGCSFSTATRAGIGLEAFLFGSTLQWHVNRPTPDQVHTPLSRLLARAWVPGPTAAK